MCAHVYNKIKQQDLPREFNYELNTVHEMCYTSRVSAICKYYKHCTLTVLLFHNVVNNIGVVLNLLSACVLVVQYS